RPPSVYLPPVPRPPCSPLSPYTTLFRSLEDLARTLRRRLVEICSEHGGHLGPNLGVVELTLALHREFRSPQEPIVFDTGHQAYRSEEHTSELQSRENLVCRLLLEKKKQR